MKYNGLALLLIVIVMVCLLLSCNHASEQIVWLECDQIEDLETVAVPAGTVELSPKLTTEVSRPKYSDDTTFAVAISFRSMIPNNYLSTLTHDGISASEYLEKAIALGDSNPTEAQKALGYYYSLKESYYNNILATLTYEGEKIARSNVCREYFFFYTYITREEIFQLACGENECLYVFAPGQFK